jgi:hypothetical protein
LSPFFQAIFIDKSNGQKMLLWDVFFSPFSKGFLYSMIVSVLLSSAMITLSSKTSKAGKLIPNHLFACVQNCLVVASFYLGNSPSVPKGVFVNFQSLEACFPIKVLNICPGGYMSHLRVFAFGLSAKLMPKALELLL